VTAESYSMCDVMLCRTYLTPEEEDKEKQRLRAELKLLSERQRSK